jgi:hypothetical protein
MLNAAPTALGKWLAIVLVGRSRERKQHVPRRGLAWHAAGAVDLERGVAVVEERHVIHPQRLGQRGVAFVARTADRVEALAASLELA